MSTPGQQPVQNSRAEIQEIWLELVANDGNRLDAFQVTAAQPRGTGVILQEIFGVNPHIQGIARQLASHGYTAIAPALFDRVRKHVALAYDKAGIDQGKELVAGITLESALLDAAAAVEHAAKFGPVTVLGFCWGGSLAWLAASRLPVAGAVAYYGGQIGSLLNSPPARPMLTHFGAQDASIPPEVAQSIS